MRAEWIQLEQDLQSLNALAVPSRAAALVDLRHPRQLLPALDFASEQSLPVVVLGQGSNVVLAERLEALVLRQACRGIERLGQSDNRISLRVAAGENWHELVTWCLREGYHGLENLALIPGTVGAAPIQNIGAYGVEISSFLEQVNGVYLHTREEFRLSARDCEFAYRDSVFKRRLAGQVLIQSVDLSLSRHAVAHTDYPALAQHLERAGAERPGPQQVFAAVVEIRRSKLPDPAEIPNVGSFFKNPVLSATAAAGLQVQWPSLPAYPQEDGSVRIPAAWLIEQCGFQRRSGQSVRVHRHHALVITNPQRRSGAEVLALAAEIRAAVNQRFGIQLQQEPSNCGWV